MTALFDNEVQWATDGRRSNLGRNLIVCWTIPPTVVGSASIVDKLATLLGPEHAELMGEGVKGKPSTRPGHLPRTHHVYFPHNFVGRKTVRNWLYPIVLRRMVRTAQPRQFDRVIGVFPDEFWLWSSFQLARRLGVPFYPFLHNTYLENRTGWKRSLAATLQKKVFDSSKVVFVANDGMREFYEENYPGLNVVTLNHINEEPIPDFEEPPPPRTPTRIAYLGTFNQSNADAFSRFVRAIQGRDDIEFTTFSGASAEFFESRGLSGPNFRHTRVAPQVVVATLRQFDIIFIPHGFRGKFSQVEYDTIFPTRTIPCLLAGRPLLVHSPARSSFNRWLIRKDCALIVDEEEPLKLIEAVHRLRSNPSLRERISRNALKAAEQFQPQGVLETFQRAIGQSESVSKEAEKDCRQ